MLRALSARAAGRHLLAQADHRHAGAAAEPPRRGRLRVRQGRPGADAHRRPDEQGTLAHVLRRSGQPRLRAPHHLQRRHQDQRRSAAARNAPARRRLAVERGARSFQAAPPAPAVHQEGRVRDQAGAGSTDLVDVNYEIEEGPSAQLGGGIGYSESQSFILSGNYADANFLGTGRRVSVDLNSGQYSKVYGVSMTEPYFTPNNVGLTGNITYRDQTQFVSASSDFSSETIGAGFDIGYPIGENQGVRMGLQFQKSSLLTSAGSSARQAIDWVAQQRQFQRQLSSTTTPRPVRPGMRRQPGRHRIQHGRVQRLVELRQPQSLAVCRPRHAPFVRPGLCAARASATSSTTSRATSSSNTSRCSAGSRCKSGRISPTAWTSATPRRCRLTASSTAADPRRARI